MNDNEIVLSLLDYYKKKNIDLYKVLDDPTFKALSLQTKLDAIKHYAQMIHDDTPHGFAARDFKSAIRSLFTNAGLGAVAGALTAAGAAATFNHGRVPSIAPIAGAILGGTASALDSTFKTLGQVRDRRFMNSEIKNVLENPTNSAALQYLTANNTRSVLTEGTAKLLDKVRSNADEHFTKNRDEFVKNETVAYNQALGNALRQAD